MNRSLVNKLRRDLAKQNKSQNQLAREIGISPAHLSQVLSGRYTPSLKLAVKLQAATGIPVEAFAE